MDKAPCLSPPGQALADCTVQMPHALKLQKKTYICGLAAWKEKVRPRGLLVYIGSSIERAPCLHSFPTPPSVSSYIIKKGK